MAIISGNIDSFVFSQKEREAGEKIVRWASRCLQVRKLEYNLRAQMKRGDSPFLVERVLTQERLDFFRKEVKAILEFYETLDGQKFLEQNSLAKSNRQRWEGIDIYAHVEPFWDPPYCIPVVVRDAQGALQAASFVSTDRRCPIVELEQLATAPHNLGKKSGAGTAAFEDAVWFCMRKGCKAIKLTAVPEAVQFYKKMGAIFSEGDGSWDAILPCKMFLPFLRERGGAGVPGKGNGAEKPGLYHMKVESVLQKPVLQLNLPCLFQ
jgi:hypothetical protein